MRRPPSQHIKRFMAAIRASRCDIGDAARAAGLTFAEATEVYAFGAREGVLRFHDKGPTERWVEEKQAPQIHDESAPGGTGQSMKTAAVAGPPLNPASTE